MSVSTDGQICYGVVFEDGYEFPWGRFDGVEEWYYKEIKPFIPIAEIYDENGEYINGIRPDEETFKWYCQQKREWKEKNPLIFELVNYCSGDCPMYILAVKSTFISCSRGYPLEIEPESLNVKESDKQKLLDFCAQYNLKFESGPSWYLSSYWS